MQQRHKGILGKVTSEVLKDHGLLRGAILPLKKWV